MLVWKHFNNKNKAFNKQQVIALICCLFFISCVGLFMQHLYESYLNEDNTELVYSLYRDKSPEESYVLFYRDDCPDCKKAMRDLSFKNNLDLDIIFINTNLKCLEMDQLKAATGIKEVPSLYLLKDGEFKEIDVFDEDYNIKFVNATE